MPPLYNRFSDREYFNSTVAQIYIGDIWIDEITSIGYSFTQNKTPIYGYASQLFDDVSYGQGLVNGAFTINFKEQGYLWVVLRRWFNMTKDLIEGTGRTDPLTARQSRILNRQKLGTDETGIGGRPIIGSNGNKVSRTGIERMLSDKMTRQERYEYYQSLAGYATVSNGIDKKFEDIVEVFEDQVWSGLSDDQLYKQIRTTEDNMFDGFDIYITLGNYANPYANHTAVKLENVRLVGRTMQIQVDDDVIQEKYEFIARGYI